MKSIHSFKMQVPLFLLALDFKMVEAKELLIKYNGADLDDPLRCILLLHR